MAILATAVGIIGLLCIVDLLMTFGIVRRLREQTEMLNKLQQPSRDVVGLAHGERPTAFSATTVGGDTVTDETPFGLIAFFSSSCSICPERVPGFIAYAARHDIPRERILAVVQQHDEAPSYLDQIARVANIVIEDREGIVSKAFQVAGFPAFCLMTADGTIAATGFDAGALPTPARA